MKDTIKASGRLEIKVDNKIIYSDHNTVMPTAAGILVQGLIGATLPNLDKVELYDGGSLMETITPKDSGVNASPTAELYFSHIATGTFNLSTLKLLCVPDDIIFSEVDITPYLITVGQSITINWQISINI
jgi:hypothetical protein